MNDELRLIRHLYGESEAPEALARDDALRQEHEQLRRVRDALDARPPARPSDGVLDRVMEAAAQRASEPSKDAADTASEEERRSSLRPDRPAVVPRSQRWTRLLSVGGALAVVLLLIIVGHDQLVEEAGLVPTQEQAAVQGLADDRAAAAPRSALGSEPAAGAASSAESADLADAAEAGASEELALAREAGDVPDELLSWDAPRAEVFEAYRRVQALHARSTAASLEQAAVRAPYYD